VIALSRGSLVWLAAALAAVSIGLAALPLPGRFAGDSGLPAPPLPAPGSQPAEVSVDSILAWSPFGRAARPTEGPAGEAALGLTLHGVVLATGREPSSAILSSGAAPARAYLVGQEVMADATLAEVHGDHVVLIVDGRPLNLAFPEERSEPAGDSGVDALQALIADTGEAPAEPQDPRATLATYGDRFRDDPQAVLDEFGLLATPEGYQVTDAAADPVLRAGLLPGDIVATVNGQQVGNIQRDLNLFDEITAAGHARVEVVRDGRRMALSFPLQ
jgi:general secretion pathway protein C